jgi:hypothetical protein
MNEQISIVREAPDEWDARLAGAYAASQVEEIPFTQRSAWGSAA